MFKAFAASLALGIVGMVAGLMIEWLAVSTWTTLSSDWLFAALIVPIVGMVGGFALFRHDVGESTGPVRALLSLAAIPLCGFSNYMAFIVASRTWFADKIPADQQSLFFQIAHPDLLPAFSTSSHNSSHSESWVAYLIAGVLVGPIAFWFTSRRW
jgi:hypothetical protein